MSVIFIDGQLAHYEVIGRGTPVLFLHGWVGSWRYWVPTMQVVSTNRAMRWICGVLEIVPKINYIQSTIRWNL